MITFYCDKNITTFNYFKIKITLLIIILKLKLIKEKITLFLCSKESFNIFLQIFSYFFLTVISIESKV